MCCPLRSGGGTLDKGSETCLASPLSEYAWAEGIRRLDVERLSVESMTTKRTCLRYQTHLHGTKREGILRMASLLGDGPCFFVGKEHTGLTKLTDLASSGRSLHIASLLGDGPCFSIVFSFYDLFFLTFCTTGQLEDLA